MLKIAIIENLTIGKILILLIEITLDKKRSDMRVKKV